MRHRESRHLCLGCRSQRARFRYRRRVRADRDHTLCFRCYRSLRDQVRLCARTVNSAAKFKSVLTLPPGGGHDPAYLQIPLALASSSPASALAVCR